MPAAQAGSKRKRSPPAAREPLPAYKRGRDESIVVDTNILIDVLNEHPVWALWSMHRLAPFLASGRAVIVPMVFAELAAGYPDIEKLERALQPLELIREPLTWEAAYRAGHAYKLYRKRGGTKRSPLPDFYIGAHALLAGHTLLTRDPRRYREYFPKLKVIAPD